MFQQFKNPEYTGPNRCLPCTVVNSIIALFIGGLVSFYSITAGSIVVCSSAALIYFRGYLVPGTPTLTKRYMPDSVLKLFGKDIPGGKGDSSQLDGEAKRLAEFDVQAYLRRVGATEPCVDQDDDCLTEDFRREWNDEIASLRKRDDLTDVILDRLAVAHEGEIVTHGDAWVLVLAGEHVGQWPSRAALLADAASAGLLAARCDQWNEFGTPVRGHIVRSLRLFLDTCPTSGGPVTVGSETVESCCSTHEVVAVTCVESGARLFEQPSPE